VDESRVTECPTREWRSDRCTDTQFGHRVPCVKWDYFSQRVRPLADESADAVWSALFAGVVRPFHYQLARGWMGQLFKTRPRRAGTDLRAGQSLEEGLSATLGWEPSAVVFMVYASNQVYTASWADVLDCLRRHWVPLDTSVMCSESSPRVAVFWEGFGPYFANRGDRGLTKHSS
jgi:hypothetical protein